MLAAANSFFGRTNISQSYNIGAASNNSRTATPTPSGSSSSAALPAVAHAPPFNVGPWRVQSASHKVTGKRVSVWSADKKSQEMERMGPASKERTLEVLKAEVRQSRNAFYEEASCLRPLRVGIRIVTTSTPFNPRYVYLCIYAMGKTYTV